MASNGHAGHFLSNHIARKCASHDDQQAELRGGVKAKLTTATDRPHKPTAIITNSKSGGTTQLRHGPMTTIFHDRSIDRRLNGSCFGWGLLQRQRRMMETWRQLDLRQMIVQSYSITKKSFGSSWMGRLRVGKGARLQCKLVHITRACGFDMRISVDKSKPLHGNPPTMQKL